MAWLILAIAWFIELISQTQGLNTNQYWHEMILNSAHISAVVFIIISILGILSTLATLFKGMEWDMNVYKFICWSWIGSLVGLICFQIVLVSLNTEIWAVADMGKATIGVFAFIFFGWL